MCVPRGDIPWSKIVDRRAVAYFDLAGLKGLMSAGAGLRVYMIG